MTPKVILAFIDGAPTSDATLETALLVAEQFDAQLQVLYVRPELANMVSLVAGGIPGAAISDPAAEMMTKSVEERTRRARAAFDRLATKAGAIATWRQETGIEPVVLAGVGRLLD